MSSWLRRGALLWPLLLTAPSRVQDARTVFLVGDSTMADKPTPERNPERGWGTFLQLHLRAGVRVQNLAVNGRSTKSFRDEGRWAALLAALRPNDVVIIQFGHNDEKSDDTTRYADAEVAFRANLAQFAREVRAAGARPVLCTPIVRRKFDATGRLQETHGRYAEVVREVARRDAVAVLDLNAATAALVGSAGPERSKRLFVWTRPGEFAMYPDGRQDDTHLSVAGATAIAELAVTAMRDTRDERLRALLR